MLRQILCAASLALLATPAMADPDKNESGKRYEEQRGRDANRRGDDDKRDEDGRYRDADRYGYTDNDQSRNGQGYDRRDDYDRSGQGYDRRNDYDRNRQANRAIPAGHLPPPGSCRVWYHNRPAGQQPPPTDCRTARSQSERYGGRIIRSDGRY